MTKINKISIRPIAAGSQPENFYCSPLPVTSIRSARGRVMPENGKKIAPPPLRVPPPPPDGFTGLGVGATIQGKCKNFALDNDFQFIINSKPAILKWVDGQGQPRNMPLTAPVSERHHRLKLTKAATPPNRLLNRDTSRHQKRFIARLGYQLGCMSYSTDAEIDRLSGSSYNRQFAKMRRDENKRLFEEQEKAEEKIRCCDPEYCKSIRETRALRALIDCKQGLKKRLSRQLPKRGVSLHFLSQRSKGKVRDKFTALYRCLGKKNKTFLTLTFIADIDDKTGQAILNKFFTELRDRYAMEELIYIWVAERQGNGNIHFHCIINKFLPVRKFNALWVLQQYNSGLRYYNYDEQFEVPIQEIRARYENDMQGKETGIMGEILNPLDVRKIKTINGLSYYLTKYITKNKNEGFACRAWHCSRHVSRLFTKKTISKDTFQELASMKNARLDKQTGALVKHPGMRSQYFQLYYIENKQYFLPEMAELEKVNAWICQGVNVDGIPQDYEDGTIRQKIFSLVELKRQRSENMKFEKGKWKKGGEALLKPGDAVKFYSN